MADGDEDPGNVERTVTDGTDAIWSTDDIPVRDGPLDLTWVAHAAAPDQPISTAHQSPLLDEFVTPSTVGLTSDERSPRSKLLIGGAALVAAAIAVGLIVRSGGADETATPETTTDAMSTIDGTTTDPPTTSGAPTTTAATGDSLFDAATVDSIGPINVELPSPVAAIQIPTEVVMLTANGLMHTLSLPSGRVRSVALADDADTSMFNGGNVVVTPEAAAILQAEGGAVVIVPRTGPPINVSKDEFGDAIGGLELQGWSRAADGSTRFVVAIYPMDCCDRNYASVGLDGEVLPLLAPQAMSSGSWLNTPDGTWIVNDAGGAYEVDTGGASLRIDSGVVQAAARDHRVVRECDVSLRCSTVLVRISDGVRRAIDPDLLPDDFDSLTYGMSLSPDGSAISVMRGGPTQERVLIDLDVGEVAAAPAGCCSQGSAWAADSSGYFDISAAGPGLLFTRRTGETVGFGAGLDQVIALGVRWPDAELDPDVLVVSEPVGAPRPLGPTGLTLIAAMTSGGMTYIDVDAGAAQTWATTERLGIDLTLIESAGAILAFGDTDEPAFAFRQGVQELLDAVFATDGVKLSGPIDGTIWVPAPEMAASRRDVAYRLVTSDGLPVDSDGSSINLPDAELLGSDGRGGLVVARGGDVFVVGVDGTERLTSGELVAIAADTAYVRECTDIASCDITRIDRRSGARSTPDGGFAAVDLSSPPRPRGAALGTSVSPDGDVLLVQLPDLTTNSPADTAWYFVDTTRGQSTVVVAFEPDQPVVWSADAKFAALISDSRLLVFDRAGGELVPLSVPRLRAIGQASFVEPIAASG